MPGASPKIMVPAGGAVPKRGHCHGSIMSLSQLVNPLTPNAMGEQPTRGGFPP